MIKSHPDKPLETHLKSVAVNSEYIVLKKNLNKILNLEKESIGKLSYLIGISHDLGKITDSFQNYIKGKTNRADPHSPVSAFFTYKLVKEYFKDHKNKYILAAISSLVVRKHHGHLDELAAFFKQDEEDIEKFKKQFNEIVSKEHTFNLYNNLTDNLDIDIKEVFENIKFDGLYIEWKHNVRSHIGKLDEKEKINAFLLTEFLFSILIDTDKKDAANMVFEESFPELKPSVVDEYLKQIMANKTKISEINNLKNEFHKYVINNKNINNKNKIYSITAPTGIGKTLVGFKLALKLSNYNHDSKIHYILPFTSIIDQNHNEIQNVVDKYTIVNKHHYLSEINVREDNEKTMEYSSYSQKSLKIQSWDYKINVSTYIQFLLSVLGSKNSFLTKFHNIVNSVVILDEVQFIGVKNWDVIRNIFTALSNSFNTFFIFMTATQPKIMKEDEIIELSDKDFFKHDEVSDKVSINVVEENINNVYIKDKILKNKIEENNCERILIILNTKKACFETFKKILDDSYFSDYKIFYLSTLLTPEDRRNKIEEIKNTYDKGKKYIIITTQLVEAGVDITSDLCIRDFAPLDSIIQSAGRCNRYNEIEKGELIILDSYVNDKDNHVHMYVYNSSKILDETRNVLKYKCDFLDLSNKFFENIKNTHSNDCLETDIKNLVYSNLEYKLNLIDDNIETYNIIILDSESEKLFDEYHKLLDLQGYDVVVKMKNVRKKLMNKSIDINKKQFENLVERGYIEEKLNFQYIPEELVNEIYSYEEGLKLFEEGTDII